MKDGLAIVQIALAFNTFENPLLASKTLFFAEAGNFEGIANYLQLNWFSMGLHPFEEGVFLKKNSTPLKGWKDHRLSLLLWNSENPSAKELKDYEQARHLHLAYLTKISLQQIIYVYLIVLQHKKDTKAIDIIFPKLDLQEIKQLDFEWMYQYGISQVTLVDFDTNDEERILWEKKSSLKKLRLIHEFPLPSSDFVKILSLSSDIVGCTGDMSLSECLIWKKIPFYEQRKHKLENWKAFQNIAKFLKLKSVDAYFEAFANFEEDNPQKTAQMLHKILQEEAFYGEWSQLSEFVQKYYSLEDSLVSHINRHLHMIGNPKLRKEEEELASKYLADKISAHEALLEMDKLLSAH